MEVHMFGEVEFSKALRAYEQEISAKGSDAFISLRRSHVFFSDIKDEDAIDEQVRLFIGLISTMDHDNYTNRYVLQTFVLDFCRYLDKDFLFYITNGQTFFNIKDKLKEFTGDIYEANKRFTQNVGLHSLEHLLQDYGSLLKHVDRDKIKQEEEKEEPQAEPSAGFGSFFEGGKLW
ncbi:MAG: hypothetical protein V3V36_00960 [Candidatus Hydrothermarchaeaceae archaeon]